MLINIIPENTLSKCSKVFYKFFLKYITNIVWCMWLAPCTCNVYLDRTSHSAERPLSCILETLRPHTLHLSMIRRGLRWCLIPRRSQSALNPSTIPDLGKRNVVYANEPYKISHSARNSYKLDTRLELPFRTLHGTPLSSIRGSLRLHTLHTSIAIFVMMNLS